MRETKVSLQRLKIKGKASQIMLHDFRPFLKISISCIDVDLLRVVLGRGGGGGGVLVIWGARKSETLFVACVVK